MLKHFYYKKSTGEITERFAHSMGIVDDKLFAVDLTNFESSKRIEYENVLNKIHSEYIQAIKDAGLGKQFRFFFFEGIKDV